MYLICTGIYKDDRTDLYISDPSHLQITKLIEGDWFKDYYKDIIEEGVTGYKLEDQIEGYKLSIQYLDCNTYEEIDLYLERLQEIQ